MARRQRAAFLLLLLSYAAVSLVHAQSPVQLASLRPKSEAVWQRIRSSETGTSALEGPVLYTIIIRSSATPNHIPRIAPSYTLTNSLISDDGTQVAIGSLSISPTGVITFAEGQTFPGAGAGQFLPLTGGTLTGDLTGVNASFSTNITSTGGIFTGNGSGLTNVNAAQLNGQLASFYQTRVNGACQPGNYIAAVNPDGTVVCRTANQSPFSAASNVKAVIDPANTSGGESSITIGTDGLPIIAYDHSTNGGIATQLSFVHCTSLDCSSHDPIRTLDSTLTSGFFPSLIIGADGLPIMSYQGHSGGGHSFFGVAHCSVADCSSSTSLFAPDPSLDSGSQTSITIGTDNMPIISYVGAVGGFPNLNVSVVHCTAMDCHSIDGALPLTATSTSFVNATAIAIGADGLPLVSYSISGTGLAVIHCTTINCSSHGSANVLDANGIGSSLIIGLDGLPVLAYPAAAGLAAVHCTAIDCSTHDSIVTLDSTVGSGQGASINIGNDGLPIVSYRGISGGNRTLGVVHCTSANCSSHGPAILLDSFSSPSAFTTSITIGTDGSPIMTYNGGSTGNVTFNSMHCANTTCTPPYIRRR